MMKWIFRLVGAVVIVALVAVVAQEIRYLNKRRNIVHDRQSIFHSSDVFHVATVLKLEPGQELLAAVGALVDAIEADGATVVYAGQIAVNALVSKQIPQEDWDAFVLAQYPSRAAYDSASSNKGLMAARGSFENTYALGMKRSPQLNLFLPIMLLGTRAADILSGHPARYPFTPAPTDQAPPAALAQRDRFVSALLAHREYGKDACVVLNFIKSGDAAEEAANEGYGSEMMKMMAELGVGPTHMGRAVTLEGDAEFDQVVIVYYPGVEFFADMVRGTFFTGIVGGKQLGDSLASPSVPLLPHI